MLYKYQLHLRFENSIRNLYLQKDNGIIGLLDLLYNGEVSENWGIIDEEDINIDEFFTEAEKKPKEPKTIKCPHCGEIIEI